MYDREKIVVFIVLKNYLILIFMVCNMYVHTYTD